MKIWVISLAIVILFPLCANSQTTACPVNMVCFEQKTANEIFDKLNQLVAAKDLIIKLQTERGTADTALANALKVVEGWKELDAVNGQIIAKKDQIITLYERVMQVQMQIIENLEKRLSRPKSPLDKIAGIIKDLGYVLAGIALGRAL